MKTRELICTQSNENKLYEDIPKHYNKYFQILIKF
jgi:hypothetical protein